MANEEESIELRMGSMGDGGGGKGGRVGECFETIKFNFMPESVLQKSGRLWRGAGKDKAGEVKVFAEFEGGVGGDAVRYSGSMQKKENINDCIVIIKDGRAMLHKLSGINIVKTISASNDFFPSDFRPPPLPDSLKRKYNMEGPSDGRIERPAAVASSDDEDSSDDSDSSDGGGASSRPVGGGKGVMSQGVAGGGKGLMLGAGKGLLTASGSSQKVSSDDDDSDEEDSEESEED